MAYSINKTDGTILATVADSQVDQFSTSLTLIGKNYSGFGEALNENFIKLLENFANAENPDNPIRGQVWFDSSELKLKVYNGTAFVPVSSATMAESQPLNLGSGDLWFDTINKQLFFYDGSNLLLLGPDYSTSQGLSGIKVMNIADTLNQNRVVTMLYNNGILIGIFSKDSFSPRLAIQGFSGTIKPGFNAGTLEGMKFYVTSSNSDQLGGIPAENYLRSDTNNQISGQLVVNGGILVGPGTEVQILVSDGNVTIANISPNKKIAIETKKGATQTDKAVEIDAGLRTVDFYSGFLDSQVNLGGSLEVSGDVTIRGSLTVNDGDITVNKYSELSIEDRIIYLAQTGDSSSNTDSFADGGGIILKGATDHEWTWNSSQTAWYSTEHINLAGKTYKIDNIPVLDSTSCYVANFPNIVSMGPQIQLTVDDLFLDGNEISTLQTDQDLVLSPNGNGNVVLTGTPLVVGISTTSEAGVTHSTESPTAVNGIGTRYVDDDELSEVVNKRYLLNNVRTRPLVFSMDTSDGISNSQIATWLTKMAPPNEYEWGVFARILCSFISPSSTTLDINSAVSTTTAIFNTPTGTANAVIEPVAFSPVIVPVAASTVVRVVKEYKIVTGTWIYQRDIP